MSTGRTDYAAEASTNLATIADVIQETGRISLADTIAVAQVQATLALVEQKRIATIAMLTAQGLVSPDDQRRTDMLNALGLS